MTKFNIQAVLDKNKTYLQERVTLAGALVESNVKRYMKSIGLIDTGRARDSVVHAEFDKVSNPGPKSGDETISKPTDELTSKIGSPVDYFPYLELGTQYMQAYAPLRVGLAASRSGIMRIFSK